MNPGGSPLAPPSGYDVAQTVTDTPYPDPNDPTKTLRDLLFAARNTGGVDPRTTTIETISTASRGKLITLSNGSAIAVTLDSTVDSKFFCLADVIGAGTATLTASSGTINGAANLAMPSGESCILAFDGTNWTALVIGAGGGSGTVTHSSGALTSDQPVFGNGGADIKVGTKSGSTDEVATVSGSLTSGDLTKSDASGNIVDAGVAVTTDGTLASDSDSLLPTEKAVKTYVDAQTVSTPVSVAHGGTGDTSLAAHAVLVGEGTSAVAAVGPGTTDYPLLGQGSSADPAFKQPRGNTSVVQMADSTTNPTTGNLAEFDANGNVKDAGIAASSIPSGIATQAGVQDESYTYAADTGSANAYAVTLSPAPGSYTAGLEVVFKAANANTGASTLNVNSLGTQSIKKLDGATALQAGDIAAGQIVTCIYDGTNFQIQSATVDSVPYGGTGKTTLSAHGVLVGEGTSAVNVTGTGTSGQVLTSNGASSDPTFQNPTTTGGTSPAGFAWGGDGSDGALTFDGTSTVAGLVPSSSIYTMTRDLFATTLQVNSGVTLKTANFVPFASQSMTINGTIDNSGRNAAGSAAASDTTSPSPNVGSLPMPTGNNSATGRNGVAGGSGTTGAGGAGTSGGNGNSVTNAIVQTVNNPSVWRGGNGGAVGATSGGTGGSSGTNGTLTATNAQPRAAHRAFGNVGYGTTLATYGQTNYQIANGVAGAPGGGGGAGDGSNAGANGGSGGGAGGSGGFLVLSSPTITIGATGVVSSNGGSGLSGFNGSNAIAGGNRGGGGGGAGGAGGNGGCVILIYNSLSNSGSIQANAGAGGSGGTGGTGTGSGGAGSNGAAGPNGSAGVIIQIQT